MVPERKLDRIIEIEYFKNKTEKEIATIWREKCFELSGYDGKNAVAGVITANIWKTMMFRFLEHRTFLFPLPRNKGYEYFVVQFDGQESHFTTLRNYHEYQEYS